MHKKTGLPPACLSLALVLLFPCKPSLAEENSDVTRKVILALFDAFNQHDADALTRLYAESASIRSPGDAEPRIGRSVVRDIYRDHFDNIPDVHDAVGNVIVEGDRGAVEFIASWLQPTKDDPNARGNLRIASFITVKGGLIVQDITYFDRVELTEKMTLDDARSLSKARP